MKRVRSWRRRYGIPTINRTERHAVPPVEGNLQSLLVGSMLGDGRLSRNPHTARFSENHSESQRPYLEWKLQQWGAWVKGGLSPRQWHYKGKTFKGHGLTTVSHPSLVPWHELFYPTPGPKQLKEEVVDLVDTRSLAIWFMDDGSNRWWPLLTFGMNLSSRGVAHGILEKFGFNPRWYTHKGKTGEFLFEGEEQAERFIALVKPHVPECMQYKLDFGFQGRGYEIRKASPEGTLRKMARDKMPIRRMARELGLSASVVSRRLEKLGISHPRTVGRPRY